MKILTTFVAAALFIAACTPALVSTPEPIVKVYLSELQPTSVSIGFSSLGIGSYPFMEDPVVTGETITAYNATYPHGLFAHAPSQIEYALKDPYLTISGYVLVHDGINCGDDVKFRILVDGREIFTSSLLTPTSTPVPFEANVTGAQTLTLKVDQVMDKDCDWSIWGNPVLTKSGEPKATSCIVITATPTLEPNAISTLAPTASVTPTITPTPSPADHQGWMPEGVLTRFGKGNFSRMAVSPDNSTVAIAASGGVYFVDPTTIRITDFIETGWVPQDLSFSPEGKQLFIGMGPAGIQIWQQTTQGSWEKSNTTFQTCGDRILLSPDGALLLAKCFSENKRLTVWDIATPQLLYQNNYNMEKNIAFAMAFSPTDPGLVAISANYTVTLVEARSGSVKSTYYEPDKNIITDLDFSPDGSILALAPYSPSVILLDVESFKETRRIPHKSDVYLLSFMDNETILSFDQKEYVVQKVNGKIIKAMERSGEPIHVYVPKYNIVFDGSYFSVEAISLDSYQVIKQIEGFHPSYWMNTEFSGDGTAFKGGVWVDRSDTSFMVSYAGNPDHLDSADPSALCGESRWSNFTDNAGKFISVSCEGRNKLFIAELKTMQVLATYPLPLSTRDNTDFVSHPWEDEQELMAMLYENPATSASKYRIEVWEPLIKNKISSFDVDIPEFNIPNQGQAWFKFSPHSKYLVVTTADQKKFLLYDIRTGSLLQTIPNNTIQASTPQREEFDLQFNEAETIFFVRNKGTVEAYYIENGGLIHRFDHLQGENMAYFDGTGELINYTTNRIHPKDMVITFDNYDLETGEKRSTHSLSLPIRAEDISDEEAKKYVVNADYAYFQPAGQGQTAVVYLHSRKLDTNHYENMLYLVDIPAESILRTFTWNYGDFFTEIYAAGNTLFTEQNNLIFKWDISVDK